MSVTKVRHGKPGRSAGFTLLEALIAMMLLAVCLLPAANALRNAVTAPTVSATAARNLDCVGSRMETVLTEPYTRLLAQVSTSKYSLPADDDCPARTVRIERYGKTSTRTFGFDTTDDHLLFISVGLTDPADGNPFTLTTLVSR
jgi:prepilin-type N-terminal cleavage/methylation domain-containing protein